jgi:hypothetical protein
VRPVLFFYVDHTDGGTDEILTEVLPYLAQIGYGHFCFEGFLNLAAEIETCEVPFKEAITSFPAFHKKMFNLPHASGINAASELLSPYDALDLYRIYSLGKIAGLLKTIQKITEISFHPIDFTWQFLPTDSPEREIAMSNEIIKVIRANINSGIIVYCGIGHYKIEQTLRQQFSRLPIISFYASQNSPSLSVTQLRLKDISDDIFIKKIFNEIDRLKGNQLQEFVDNNSCVKILGLKLNMINEQLIYETVRNLLSPHNLLMATIEKYMINPNDKQILQNREYGKFLRIVCANGRADLLELLLHYRSLIPAINPDEKNLSAGLSARDYAQQKNHIACVNLLNGYH